MIEIRKKDKHINITGHAGYAEPGKDIVCAAVSTLVATFTNVYDVDVLEDDINHMELEWKEDIDTEFFYTGLQLVENTYPAYVKIIDE